MHRVNKIIAIVSSLNRTVSFHPFRPNGIPTLINWRRFLYAYKTLNIKQNIFIDCNWIGSEKGPTLKSSKFNLNMLVFRTIGVLRLYCVSKSTMDRAISTVRVLPNWKVHKELYRKTRTKHHPSLPHPHAQLKNWITDNSRITLKLTLLINWTK